TGADKASEPSSAAIETCMYLSIKDVPWNVLTRKTSAAIPATQDKFAHHRCIILFRSFFEHFDYFLPSRPLLAHRALTTKGERRHTAPWRRYAGRKRPKTHRSSPDHRPIHRQQADM